MTSMTGLVGYKKLLAALLAVWIGNGLMYAETPSKDEVLKLQKANAYLEVMPPRDMIERMAIPLLRRLPEDQKNHLLTDVIARLDFQAIDDIHRRTLVKHFTADELASMTTFYGSGVGQSIYRKTPAYTADLFRALLPVVLEVVRKNTPTSPAPSSAGRSETIKPQDAAMDDEPY